MKNKTALTLIVTALVSLTAVAQPPPPPPPAPSTAPATPVPPVPPTLPDRHDKRPKVPVTFLGVETSDVPRVVCEQLGLAKGFGLVVDYVVPEGPAAAAGVQANDILKMLNDQILTEPDQLSKLIRSFPEGTTVTMTVLRKGQEQKIPVKLGKKEVPQPRSGGGSHIPADFHFEGMDLGDLGDRMRDMKENMAESKQDMIQDAVMKAQEEVERVREASAQASEQTREKTEQARERVREQVQRAREQAQRAREQAQRVREMAHNGDRQIRITRTDDAGLRTTRIDMAKAQIVFSDDKGELRIEKNDGKKILTAKDPQGKLLFSGPVETEEDLGKVPADVRDRYNKLKEKDLPSVVSPADDEDNDESEEMNDEKDNFSVEQVSSKALPHRIAAIPNLIV